MNPNAPAASPGGSGDGTPSGASPGGARPSFSFSSKAIAASAVAAAEEDAAAAGAPPLTAAQLAEAVTARSREEAFLRAAAEAEWDATLRPRGAHLFTDARGRPHIFARRAFGQ